MTDFVTETAKQVALANERRAAHRRRVLKAGSILFNKGYGALGCKVRNMTEQGALLELGETTGMPQKFDFRITNEDEIRSASIVWRDKMRIGIRFAK